MNADGSSLTSSSDCAIGTSAPESCLGRAVARLPKADCTTNPRGRPRITTERPWDIQGISRRTYYARIKPTLPTQISYAADQPRWFCLRTGYGAEKRVSGELAKKGFETFFPQRWIPPVAARRTETGRALPATPGYLVPLLPRYLMIRFDRSDPSWRYIPSMDDVDRIFGTSPEWPTPIPESDMDALRKGLREDGILYPDRPIQADVTKKRWIDMATALIALQTEVA